MPAEEEEQTETSQTNPWQRRLVLALPLWWMNSLRRQQRVHARCDHRAGPGALADPDPTVLVLGELLQHISRSVR